MAQTCTALQYHIVFATQQRTPRLTDERRDRVLSYMAGISRENGCLPLKFGGYVDHVHLLVSIPATHTVAAMVQKIKGGTSAWINENHVCGAVRFAWQKGYGAFTVSRSRTEAISRYIDRQPEHHRLRSFQEEYRELLKRHGIEVDERYLWD